MATGDNDDDNNDDDNDGRRETTKLNSWRRDSIWIRGAICTDLVPIFEGPQKKQLKQN
jgi:hypothetical protein